jgi:D-alanine-D-alanine ligase
VTKIKIEKDGQLDMEKVKWAEVIFPVTHGTFGEDGCLQGLLEILDKPYVGAGVLGSAVGMDKEVMKRLLTQANIPVAKWEVAKRWEVSEMFLKMVVASLKFPVFVKPANLGSSVGITKAHDIAELRQAVQTAGQYDSKIIFEENIAGREIEVAVLGNDRPEASVPGEIKTKREFYDYQAKYVDENGAILEIPAKLPKTAIKEAQTMSIRAFRALECAGMARVDMFLTPRGRWIVNEINTLPGFTNISMYPKLWEASGLPYPKLLDRLINLALERKKLKDELKRSYN